MFNFLSCQARKERKEREFFSRFLGGPRRERAGPYSRESPHRNAQTSETLTERRPPEESSQSRQSVGEEANITSITGEEGASVSGDTETRKRNREDENDGTFKLNKCIN